MLREKAKTLQTMIPHYKWQNYKWRMDQWLSEVKDGVGADGDGCGC